MVIKSLYLSSRPKTLLVGIAPVLLASSLVFSQSNDSFSFIVFILTIMCVLLLQTGTNVVNEYYDYLTGVDDIDRLGPKRALINGDLKPLTLKKFFIACFILSFLFGVYLMIVGGAPIVSIGLISIIVAFAYTGGPYPLSHYALGEFLAFLFFGPIAAGGTYYLQTHHINQEIIILSLVPGFISAALMSLNNLRDIETDKKTKKITIAILLGNHKARYFTLLLTFFPTLILYNFYNSFNHFYILLLPPILFIPLWKKILFENKMTELNKGIAMFGAYNVLYCFLLSIKYLLF